MPNLLRRSGVLASALALGFGLAAAASPSSDLEEAGWTFVAASEETFVYMKDAEHAQGVRRVWSAYDSSRRRERAGFAFMSVASLGEFDCERRMSRVVRETFYERPGLSGQSWSPADFTPTEWAASEPGSVGDVRMGFACRDHHVT